MVKLLKRIGKAVLPQSWQTLITTYVRLPAHLEGVDNRQNLTTKEIKRTRQRLAALEAAVQKNAAWAQQQYYSPVAGSRWQGSGINAHEMKCHSQNGEDGILLYVFSKIGTGSRSFVEFGIGDGRECNSANLSLNFGWAGLLMESDHRNVAAAAEYYQERLGPKFSDLRILERLVTAENINETLRENGIEGAIDLLSIDIDGNDYWVWKAITAIKPRVVVIEYNASFGSERSLTIKYDPDFSRGSSWDGYYHGGSITALTKLGKEKGYVMVGCDSSGTNAFFVCSALAEGKLREASVADAYFPSQRRSVKLSNSAQWDRIKDLAYEGI